MPLTSKSKTTYQPSSRPAKRTILKWAGLNTPTAQLPYTTALLISPAVLSPTQHLPTPAGAGRPSSLLTATLWPVYTTRCCMFRQNTATLKPHLTPASHCSSCDHTLATALPPRSTSGRLKYTRRSIIRISLLSTRLLQKLGPSNISPSMHKISPLIGNN